MLLLPGIGVADDLRDMADRGVQVARIATHCTEADISEQHIRLAKRLGMEAVGFLMMAHMAEPAALLEQARLMESYGADCVYVVDSAGAMTTADARARVGTLAEGLGCQVGHHAHNNLSLAVANSLAALEAGADQLDGCCAGLGAGAGNCPTEVLVATCDKLGLATGVDPLEAMGVAEDLVRPLRPEMGVIDRAGLLLGYAGVYGSFLLHAQRAAARYGVDVGEILLELGRRRIVGGQEDMILDVALELARQAGQGVRPARPADPVALAQHLAGLRQGRTAGTGLTAEHPGLDLEVAYAVQEAGVRLLVAAGERQAGFKLGLTSRAKQAQMGVAEPLYGELTDAMLLDVGEPLDTGQLIQPRVEPEIAFLLGADLAGERVGAAQVLAATAAVAPAIEVLDSRYAGYAFTLPDVVADNASAARLVLGGVRQAVDGIDLRLVGCVLELGGQVRATAAGAAALGHPAAAVAWLVRALHRRGRGLAAGDVVLSGGLTEAVPVAPGDVVVARLGRLGTVELAVR